MSLLRGAGPVEEEKGVVEGVGGSVGGRGERRVEWVGGVFCPHAR